MTLKFHLIRVGERFRYEGESYLKVTPLVAEQAGSGARRLLRKAALVERIDDEPPVSSAEPPAARDVLAAFDVLHRTAIECLERLSRSEAPDPGSAKAELDRVRDDQLRRLGLR